MKFVIDERIKYRLTGLIVILSIIVIFVPVLVKKSNQRLEENVSISVKLPSKPALPKVAVNNEKTLFQSVKLAHVDRPLNVEAPKVEQIVKAESISSKSAIPSLAKNQNQFISNDSNQPKSQQRELYTVQLASFSQQNNAEVLVTKLRSMGYVANYNKFSSKQGEIYKVTVGQLTQRSEAVSLQKKLALSMQLHGFIVKTGVS